VWEAILGATTPRFQVHRLAGAMRVDAPWFDDGNTACRHVTFEFEPGSADTFECQLHYYDSVAHLAPLDVPFDRAVAAVEREFDDWAARIPSLPPAFEPGRKLAAYVLWSETVGPHGLYRTPVVWCSKGMGGNTIFSWDHCFAAIGLAEAHPELAWQQFMILRDMQDPTSGMLCDSMTNIRRSWYCTKSPIHGWTLGHLLRVMPQVIFDDRLREAYGCLRLWTQFWLTERNLDGDGLPCILHPNESFDNTTANTLEGAVKPPEIAAFLVLQTEVLADVAERLGYAGEARQWRSRSEGLLQTMLRLLWDNNRHQFVARRVGDGRVGSGDCLFNYVPLLLGKRLPEPVRRALVEGLTRPGRFLTPFGLASEALDSPRYNENSYVKGPIWAPPNTFISEGLASIGEGVLAIKIREGFCTACLKGGMCEHFNSRNGAPVGPESSYIWTAAMYLWLGSRQS
jgi:hypothetical protein